MAGALPNHCKNPLRVVRIHPAKVGLDFSGAAIVALVGVVEVGKWYLYRLFVISIADLLSITDLEYPILREIDESCRVFLLLKR